MRPRPKPGFWLVAKREWRWLLHDRVAIILIFGVPLFAFVVLGLVFSHPVIRGLGVVVVDEDRSETSRAVRTPPGRPVWTTSSMLRSPGLLIASPQLARSLRSLGDGAAQVVL